MLPTTRISSTPLTSIPLLTHCTASCCIPRTNTRRARTAAVTATGGSRRGLTSGCGTTTSSGMATRSPVSAPPAGPLPQRKAYRHICVQHSLGCRPFTLLLPSSSSSSSSQAGSDSPSSLFSRFSLPPLRLPRLSFSGSSTRPSAGASPTCRLGSLAPTGEAPRSRLGCQTRRTTKC